MARRHQDKLLYNTFKNFLNLCLLEDHSLIWPDIEVWTTNSVLSVKKRLIDAPIFGSTQSFEEKLNKQMKEASTEEWAIICDIYYIYFLPSQFITLEKKQSDITHAANRGGLRSPAPNAEIWEPQKTGFTRTGQKYHQKYAQFWLILLFTLHVKEHEDPKSLISKPQIMQQSLDMILDNIPKGIDRAYDMRHAMLYMAFPDLYERIISTRDKQEIAKTYRDRIQGPIPADLDECIRKIREVLSKQYDKPGHPFDFYDDLKAEWRGQKAIKSIKEKRFLEKNYWIFQANPKYYDLEGALRNLKEQNWTVSQHKDKIRKGDKVYLWQSGPKPGIYGVADILTDPGFLPEDVAEKLFIKEPEKFEGKKPAVRLSIKYVLKKPVSKAMLLREPNLSDLTFLTAPYGTNFSLTPKQADFLEKLIGAPIEPRVWWVNQGVTMRAEIEGGFLWAPLKTKTGRSMSHWKTMAEVSPDDIVVHYANGALRYVSKVLEPAVETPKPASLMEGEWSNEGLLARVEYHELTHPIPLQKFADVLRPHDISQGPLDSSGGVKQGYLFRLTPKALGIIQGSQSETVWPVFARIIVPPPPRNPEYPLSQIDSETGFPEDTLARWVHAIERKGQAIVYGPPGTGKTFLAEKLALHLIGGGDGFREVVQFHPAYSYEDFVQGIRPKARDDGQLDYPVVPGRFVEFCALCQSRQGRCVLIIDEINRANLSQVFGELMYLLEYRDRDVPLASGGVFQIPTNVRLIGTMNTADRSIALVDHALRRRFAFLALYPNYEVLSKYHADTGFPVENLIQTLRQLNYQIGDRHYEVGITFFLRKDLEGQIGDIWQMEIEPYLEEYFFDQPEKVSDYRWNNIQQKILS